MTRTRVDTTTDETTTGAPTNPVAGSHGGVLPTAKTAHQHTLPPSMGRMGERTQLAPAAGIDLPAILAQLTKPIVPMLKKIRYRRHGPRDHNPSDILLPSGYAAEVVATGLNTPVACCFDDAGACYVIEGGHKVGWAPRIIKVDTSTGRQEVFFTWPDERWNRTGAVTGATWHDGALYVCNTDTVSRIDANGQIQDIVTGLPGRGDHQVNQPTFGPDGLLYFAVGTATNSGVVGPDNAAYEWLPDHPTEHDVPARDVTLAGTNFQSHDVLGDQTKTVRTGAFVPYGTETAPGQVIRGKTKSTALLRCNPDGSNLEVVAWGLRNPYGIDFHPDGRLFVTEHGMDDRNRHVIGDYDDFYEIVDGAWYGWPDFASGIRLDDPRWGEGGRGREPVLATHPDPDPPKPFVTFAPHAAANGFAFSRSPKFGFHGDAFVALFGDLAPVTTARLTTPVGYKVVRVDMKNRIVVDFAVNKIEGPASKLPHSGFERPSDCEFGPDGALYVTDWGEIDIAPEAGGVRMQAGTGTLWRIRRTTGPVDSRPPKPATFPFYLAQLATWIGVPIAFAAGLAALIRRRRR
jgi:glucose/arabinose dehydrogenase